MFVFRGELKNAEGKVLEVIKTNMSEGGGEHSDGTPIYRFPYEFEFESATYRGESYSVGKKKNRGQKVTIEFPPGRPGRSRIQGMRTAAFSSFVLFVVIFPVVGVCFLVPGFVFGRRTAKLLKVGEYTTGKLIETKGTGTEINNRRVYQLTFEFQTQSGETRTAVAKTHETHTLEDDEHEPLLYDPIHPDRATMLDHLPGRPEFDSEGQIRHSGWMNTFLCLIVPTATVVGHSIAFYYLFLI